MLSCSRFHSVPRRGGLHRSSAGSALVIRHRARDVGVGDFGSEIDLGSGSWTWSGGGGVEIDGFGVVFSSKNVVFAVFDRQVA